MKKIYVLVHVTYDYYRFQTNVAASNNQTELLPLVPTDGVLYTYKEEPQELRKMEKEHYWIEEFDAASN